LSFKVGDRVRITAAYEQYAGLTGTVERVNLGGDAYPYALTLDPNDVFKSEGGDFLVERDEIEALTPQFVNVVTSRSIWVTLPGDNAGHRLTESEARALFVQLEEIL
jgi:hypothetical protein